MSSGGHMSLMQSMLRNNGLVGRKHTYFDNKNLYVGLADKQYHKRFKQLTPAEKEEIRLLIKKRREREGIRNLILLFVALGITGWLFWYGFQMLESA